MQKLRSGMIEVAKTKLINQFREEPEKLEGLIRGWVSGDHGSILEFEDILERNNLSSDDILSQAYRKTAGEIILMASQISNLERQRGDLLRNIDRRRDAFARRFRDISRNINTGYSVVADGKPIPKDRQTASDLRIMKRRSAEMPDVSNQYASSKPLKSDSVSQQTEEDDEPRLKGI